MRHLTFVLLSVFILSFSSCKSSKVTATNQPKSKKTKEHPKGNIHESNDKAVKVIKTARSYIGTPYKFGGTSRAGLDCSGLMLLCFKEVDINLPRTSAQQSTFGTALKYSELEPGDLVFFTDKKGGSKVVHAGLVSKVNGPRDVKFIHSSTKLGVVESDLYVSYYENILIKARRAL